MKKFIHVFFIIIALSIVYSPISQAQNWTALPPYNTLWPLWSPALSPIDTVTGLPVPIITELTHNTVLPVEPGLTWYSELSYPWLLYNTPAGLAYYDPVDGVNLWPPKIFMALPLPLTLPPGYADLPPTDPTWITTTVPVANSAILGLLSIFGGFGGATIVPPTFLAPSALLPPVIVPPLIPTIVAPPPIPTVAAPTLVTPTVVAPTIVAPVTTVVPTAVISGLLLGYDIGTPGYPDIILY